ncbi:Protein MEI2-like 6 [Carex littledalei]|uniref:Protein MEI2-like 6 n=1 Tax=Carex littledalei TaxID=544730 RepID=A0A833V4G3_9POAL|nr:Protein MEI2-like 6 [Carex littledalei]
MSIITLNHEARSFFPSRRNTLPSATLYISPPQNPNPFLSYYNYPFYQYFTYQYFSFPLYSTFQLVSPPCTPTLPPSVPRCSIEELDESLGSEKSSAEEEMVVPKPIASTSVVKCRRTRAPRCQEPRRGSSVKVSHRMYEIREDADLEMEGKTTLMIKNIPGKFRQGRLIAVLRDHCIAENRKALASEGDEAVLSEFDYFYLPIDFREGCYHVVNGLAESIDHADEMIFHPNVPDMFLPVHFEPPYNGLNESVEYIHGRRA